MSAALVLRPIPFDICHACAGERYDAERDVLDQAMYGLGLPVALSEIESEHGQFWIVVRYCCPRCRAVWDMTHSVEMEGAPMGRFVDGYPYIDDEWTAPQIGGTPFPAGPQKVFTRGGLKPVKQVAIRTGDDD